MHHIRYEAEAYTDRAQATRALERLRAIGYERDHVSLIVDEKDLPADQNFESDSSPLAAHGGMGGTGVAVGAASGAVLGAIVAAAASIAMIAATEGAAAIFVVGPLAAALGGLGAGIVGGGIVGGMLELGIEARDWRTTLRNGGLVVVVALKSHDDAKPVREALTGS